MDAKPRDHRCKLILGFIEDYYHHHGFAPAYKEIGVNVGLKSKSSVAAHTQHLAADGLINISSRGAVPTNRQEKP